MRLRPVQVPGKMLMQFLFRSNLWKWRVRSAKVCPPAKTVSAATDPLAYAVEVYRDEVALSRFIKRLSASGAEHIRVTYIQDRVACVQMRRPSSVADWGAVVARLIVRCGLRCAASAAADDGS